MASVLAVILLLPVNRLTALGIDGTSHDPHVTVDEAYQPRA
jgi:hypothetical protein